MNSAKPRLQIFFDGRCYICSKEIDIYRKRNQGDVLEFIDIAHQEFEADAHGVDPLLVNKEFHVKDENGTLFTGVEAFIKVWTVLPGWQRAADIANIPLINALMKVGYVVFANVRPYLPHRKKTCSNGACFR